MNVYCRVMFEFNYSIGDIKNSELGEGIDCLGGKGGGRWGKGRREEEEKGEGSGGKGEGSGECQPPPPPPRPPLHSVHRFCNDLLRLALIVEIYLSN